MHIPFCKGKCNYCSFYSDTCISEEILDEFTRDIKETINFFSTQIDFAFNTVYFGGGTPSILGSGRLSELLLYINNSFDIDSNAEITLECNPESVNIGFFKEVKETGFNRISMGLQSSSNEVLKKMGRLHTKEGFKTAFENAREAGFKNISLDIIYGAFENENINETLDFALELSPEHISAYALKLEEESKFYKDNFDFPSEEYVVSAYDEICSTLKENGYNHYEISNFSKEGFESKHNNIYWQLGDYLGIGKSACSKIGNNRFSLWKNKIESKDDIKSEEVLDKKDEIYEYIMLSLRMSEGLNINYLKEKLIKCESIKNIDSKIKKLNEFINLCEKNKLCRVKNGEISLTDEGMFVSNSIILKLQAIFDEV